MEYCAWSELKAKLSSVPNNCIQKLIGDLANAVQFLESIGLVHRDIKPENILVAEDFSTLKLIDFGVLREISPDEDRSDGTDHGLRRPFIATAQYSSPEYLFRLEAPSPNLWKGLSIYQVGAVLHDLLTKKPIFDDDANSENRYVLAMAVHSKAPTFEQVTDPAYFGLRDLASHCLQKGLSIRIALVDWADFHPSKENSMDALKRRLEKQQIKNAQEKIAGNQSKASDELKINRVGLVAEALRAKIIDERGPQGIRIEQFNKKGAEQFSMRLVLPYSEMVVDTQFHFGWTTASSGHIAPVSVSALLLRHRDASSLWNLPGKTVTATDLASNDWSTAIETLSLEAARILEIALERIGQSFEKFEQVALDLQSM